MNAEGEGRAAEAGAAPVLYAHLYRQFPSAPANAEEDTGKFVILSRRHEIHLVLSPVAFTPYHANIVYQYLQAEGRGRVTAAKDTGCRILSPEWAVRGGGFFSIQHWLHHMRLDGKSSAFGRFEETLLQPFLDEIPEKLALTGYTLEIG